MPKVNRNDPCPCGSGKKYKNCCMRRDQISASRELSLSPLEGAVFDRLVQFVQLPRFNQDLTEAFRLYWGGAFEIEAARELGPDDVRRMLEWFVYDYHTSIERRYLVDVFAETEGVSFAPEAQEILTAWRSSVCGLFRVLATESSRRLLNLYDSLHQRDLDVQDAMLSRTVQRGDLLVGRLFEVEGVRRLSFMTMILPSAFEPEMAAYVHNAYQRYVADHYQATWDQFLRENGHLWNAYLLSHRGPSLRSLLGPGTRFHDPSISRDKLRAFTERRAAERAREMRKEEDQEALSLHRTATGIIVPGEAPAEAPKPDQKGEAPKRPTVLIPGRDF